MYLTRSLLVVVVALAAVDIWSVDGTKHPRTTRAAKITSTTKKVDAVDLEQDKRFHYHPKPQLSTVKPSLGPLPLPPLPLPSLPLPTVRPTLPPPPPPLYPVPSTKPPHRPPHFQTVTPSRPPPPQQSRPTTTPAPTQPTLPTGRPTFLPIFGSTSPQYPAPTTRPPATARPLPPQPIPDEFYNRYQDGTYEFRYELPDETVRYERAYLVRYQHQTVLAKKGFYSYRLPDKRYHTVFYTSDQFGHNQDSSFSLIRPELPRSLKVDETRDDELRTADEPVTATPTETTLPAE